MAHLRKRGDNWQICVEAGHDPITGERKRIYETVEGTKKEAEKRMHELAYEIENGEYIEPSDLTLKEFLHQWFEDYCENNLAQSTKEYYDIIINSHIIPILGNIKIADLKPMHIKKYISHKLKDGRLDGKPGGLSKKSVKRHYTTLRRALKHAVQWQLIEKNPADPISAPTPDKPQIQAMTDEQLNKLLANAKGWVHDLILLAAFTGMRRGELLALRWKDVDLKKQKVHVRQSVSEVKGGDVFFKEPKTKSSIRPIDIDEDVANMLKRRNKEQKENRLKLGNDYNDKYNLVLLKSNGDPYLPDHATKSFKRMAKKVGLGEFRLHDLRHTHASLMLRAGIHPKIVQERLGHSSITQTLDTYSHVIPSMQKEAVQKLKNSLKK